MRAFFYFCVWDLIDLHGLVDLSTADPDRVLVYQVYSLRSYDLHAGLTRIVATIIPHDPNLVQLFWSCLFSHILVDLNFVCFVLRNIFLLHCCLCQWGSPHLNWSFPIANYNPFLALSDHFGTCIHARIGVTWASFVSFATPFLIFAPALEREESTATFRVFSHEWALYFRIRGILIRELARWIRYASKLDSNCVNLMNNVRHLVIV